jgi:hypothetical protein
MPTSAKSLAQDVPTLTVYRSSLCNLNGEATRRTHGPHTHVDLLPPARKGDCWRLDRRAGSPYRLRSSTDRGHLRFRARYRIDLLFADQPAEVTALRFVLALDPENPELFRLKIAA